VSGALAPAVEQYLRQAVIEHPAEPVGERCPFCRAVGLPGRIPCAVRILALGTLRSVEVRR
jgi:hypothetical protein